MEKVRESVKKCEKVRKSVRKLEKVRESVRKFSRRPLEGSRRPTEVREGVGKIEEEQVF